MKNKTIEIKLDLSKPVENITNETIIPPMKEISKGLTTILGFATTIVDNSCYKYIESSKYKKEQFIKNLEIKYKEIPSQHLTEPNIAILGNTLDAIKYYLNDDYIIELYSNIIISDIDVNTKNKVHISYVETLKQLNKNDLEILTAMYKVKNNSFGIGKLCIIDAYGKQKDYTLHNSIYISKINNYFINDYNEFSNSLENLFRLGLIEINYTKYFHENYIYDNMLNKVYPSVKHILEKINQNINEKYKLGYEKGMMHITNMGLNLMNVCLRTDI